MRAADISEEGKPEDEKDEKKPSKLDEFLGRHRNAVVTFAAILGILLFGSDNSTFTVMFVALPCAALGGLISFLIAKFGPRGDYVDPSVQPVNFYTNNNGMPMYGTGAQYNPQYNPQQVPVQPSPMQPNASPFAPAAGQPVQPSPFAPAPGAAASGIRYCMNCGAPNSSTSKFCESCGQNIG